MTKPGIRAANLKTSGSCRVRICADKFERHHRRARAPIAYPAKVTIPVASEYQVARKRGLSSVQWVA